MKLLFVTSNRIGDAVLSTGLLGHLLEAHGHARVTIACGPAPAPLFRSVPGLDRLIVLQKRRFGTHWLGLWTRTATTRWDLVVDLRASALAWALPAKARRIAGRHVGGRHKVIELAAVLGLDEPPAPRLWLADSTREEAQRLIPDQRPVLALGPTANWGGKIWPTGRFAETVGRLTAEGAVLAGARVAVFGAAEERALAEPLLAALPERRSIDLVGRVSLPEAAACLERAALFVGNDSGLMHIAAAAGTPTLGLFGPSKEAIYGPWGRHTRAVRTERSYDQIVSAPGYDYRSHDSHMDSLSVDAVVDAAIGLWQRVHEAAA